MKKNFIRKLTAGIAALSLCAMAAAPLMSTAADLTINGTTNVSVANKTFKAYKLFEVSEATSGFFVNCTIPEVQDYFDGKITEEIPEGELNTAIGNYLSDIEENGTEQEKINLARELLIVAKKAGITPKSVTADGDDTSAVITGLDAGYYVIEDASSGAGNAISSVMLKNITENVPIALKADKPTITKKIDENGTLVDANTASIGDTVNYQLNTKVPNTKYYSNYNFKITDEIVEGLDLCTADGVAITVMGDNTATAETVEDSYELTQDTDYEVTFVDAAEDGHKEQMVINFLKMAELGQTNAGNEIIVKYSAVLNENAEVGTSGNVNDVVLEYSNNPNWNANDTDGDGTPDTDDGDMDNDNTPDDEDDDWDNDGEDNNEDTDDDGDGIPDDEDDDDNSPSSTTQTVHDKVLTYVTEIKIAKVDALGKALGGATFSITGEGVQYIVKTSTTSETFTDGDGDGVYDDGEEFEDTNDNDKWDAAIGDTVVTVSTTGTSATGVEATVSEDGFLVFRGLGAGTYKITETDAPADYNKYNGEIEVKIECTMVDGDDNDENNIALGAAVIGDGTEKCKWSYTSTAGGDVKTDGTGDIFTITVVNRKGVTFPETGGIGTAIFTIVGLSMMIGAAGIYVVKKRVINN